MTTNNSTTITNPVLDDTGEIRISSVKITKLASGYDQIEVKSYHNDLAEAARLATEVWNSLWGSNNFMMPVPKEGTERAR